MGWLKKASRHSHLFSYGTLRENSVQLTLFNRLLSGTPDTLLNYRLTQIKLSDQDGTEHYYPGAYHTGNPKDQIAGVVFQLSYDELLRADLYETQAYIRRQVQLVSGKQTWVYICTI